MNWRREAQEKLGAYADVRRSLENIPMQILWLKKQCGGVSRGWSDSPGIRATARSREDAIINNIAARQELQWSLEQARRWVKIVDRGLAVLEPEERLILEQLYMYPQAGALEKLCLDLGVEKTSIYRRRDRALEKFTRALYGVTESN